MHEEKYQYMNVINTHATYDSNVRVDDSGFMGSGVVMLINDTTVAVGER